MNTINTSYVVYRQKTIQICNHILELVQIHCYNEKPHGDNQFVASNFFSDSKQLQLTLSVQNSPVNSKQ